LATIGIFSNSNGNDSNANVSEDSLISFGTAQSNYQDVGDTRMQWGLSSSSSDNIKVILPKPFANNNYVVTLMGTFGAAAYPGENVATTAVNGLKTPTEFSISTSDANAEFDWIAVGVKP